MSILKIEENDVLWRYYEKAYTLEESKVVPPANFCHYFWTGLYGIGSSFYLEAKLWIVWLIFLILALLTYGIGCVLHSDLAALGFMGSLIVTLTHLAIAIFTTDARLKGTWQNVYRGTWLAAGFGGMLTLIGGVVYMIYDFVTRQGFPPLSNVVWGGLQGIGIVAMTFGGMLLTTLILFFAWQYVISPMGSWRFVQSIWLALKSFKHQICPLVEPPESFMATYEATRTKTKS